MPQTAVSPPASTFAPHFSRDVYEGKVTKDGRKGKLIVLRLDEADPNSQGVKQHVMPLVGLGTWKAQPGQVKAAVLAAIQSGYKHIDCAAVYNNEHEVGEALETGFREGVVQRQDMWITSKLWNTHHAAGAVGKALRRSLKDLNLDYLDLYLIHWPATGNKGPTVQPSIKETWLAMEELVRQGLVRAIGVSNFSSRKLDDILSYATIKPAVCQIEAHPYFRNDALIAWCRSCGIFVTAYSPLGSPDSASMFKRENAPTLMQDPVVQSVAQRLGKSAAQVLIRWGVQRGTSVLPKSTSPERIASNLAVWDWEIPADDFARLSCLPQQRRCVNASFLCSPAGPYKNEQEFWDE